MAIRITKVYTRTGDKGETALVGGKRVGKDTPRIEAYGTVDELNAAVGVARAVNAQEKKKKAVTRLEDEFQQIQQLLFNLGSELACDPADLIAGMPMVSGDDILRLETVMDEWLPKLPPLKSFILPGGGALHAQLHVCRTVCRRAERVVIRLGRVERVRPEAIMFLNRLSDYFFVAGRWAGQQQGHAEILWQTGKPVTQKMPNSK